MRDQWQQLRLLHRVYLVQHQHHRAVQPPHQLKSKVILPRTHGPLASRKLLPDVTARAAVSSASSPCRGVTAVSALAAGASHPPETPPASRDSSASCTSCIMRRSSCVSGLCTPGVSTSTTCAAGRPATPFILFTPSTSSTPTTLVRVVCGLCVTIASFCPSSAFSNVDFPAFGRPMMETKPERKGIPPLSPGPSSARRRKRRLHCPA